MLIKYPRGAVYWLRDTAPKFGSIQAGSRPCVIISNTTNNIHSSILTVIPITSQAKTTLPVHVKIPAITGGPEENIVLCEQIRCIDKAQLNEFCGILSPLTVAKIEEALKIQLGFTPIQKITSSNEKEPKIENENTNNTTSNEKKPVFKNETGLNTSSTKNGKEYSDEYKQQFLEDAEKLSSKELSKKYGITAKAAWARKSSWTMYFKNKK